MLASGKYAADFSSWLLAPIAASYQKSPHGEAAAGIDDKELARLRLDDEVRAYAWDPALAGSC